MKKIISLALGISLLVLFWCSKIWTPAITNTTGALIDSTTITTQTAVAERQTYENKTDGFSLQFPGTRTFQEKAYGSSVMFFTPLISGDTIKENVGIMKKPLDKDYTLDDYYTLTKPELVKLIPNFTEISNETIQVNGLDAKKLIYTWTQWDAKLQWEQIYLIKNQAAYIITYTATATTFKDFSQKIDQMLATLEIK